MKLLVALSPNGTVGATLRYNNAPNSPVGVGGLLPRDPTRPVNIYGIDVNRDIEQMFKEKDPHALLTDHLRNLRPEPLTHFDIQGTQIPIKTLLQRIQRPRS
jgi:hypothetical protein